MGNNYEAHQAEKKKRLKGGPLAPVQNGVEGAWWNLLLSGDFGSQIRNSPAGTLRGSEARDLGVLFGCPLKSVVTSKRTSFVPAFSC